MNQQILQTQFTVLYEREADNIFRFCLLRCSDREQALDLTQETFVRAWQTLSSGKALTNERAFLFTVAHRLIIDWYRKKKPVSLESLADPESGEPYEPPTDLEAADLELKAEGRFLLESIAKIGLSYRQAVYLRFVEGLSPPEIGEVLGISANAASVRINRGLDEVRKITGYEIGRDKESKFQL